MWCAARDDGTSGRLIEPRRLRVAEGVNRMPNKLSRTHTHFFPLCVCGVFGVNALRSCAVAVVVVVVVFFVWVATEVRRAAQKEL